MKRSLSVSIEPYRLEVAEFDNWKQALADIELGQIQMKIVKILGVKWPYTLSAELEIPCKSLSAKEQIVCALLLEYPKGLTKEILQGITGMTSDSVATYLTSKEKGIALGIIKEEENYRLKEEWVVTALAIAENAFEKCG